MGIGGARALVPMGLYQADSGCMVTGGWTRPTASQDPGILSLHDGETTGMWRRLKVTSAVRSPWQVPCI